jgi:hypothetical protein
MCTFCFGRHEAQHGLVSIKRYPLLWWTARGLFASPLTAAVLPFLVLPLVMQQKEHRRIQIAHVIGGYSGLPLQNLLKSRVLH